MCMFGDQDYIWFQVECQNMPKKGQQEFFFYIKQGSIIHSFNIKTFIFYIPVKNLHVF